MRSGAHWRVHTSLQEATPVQFQPVLTMEKGNSGGLDLWIFQQMLCIRAWCEIAHVIYLGNKRDFVKKLCILFFLTVGGKKWRAGGHGPLLWSTKEWPPKEAGVLIPSICEDAASWQKRLC